MRRALPWAGVALTAGAALVAVAMLAVALGARSDAAGARQRAERLYEARKEVARAQDALGGSDIEEAVTAAREANATALRVGRVTSKIVDLLQGTDDAARVVAASSRRAARTAAFTSEQTAIARDILGAIAGYQRAARGHTAVTNRALQRILRSLRETNRSFPGGGR